MIANVKNLVKDVIDKKRVGTATWRPSMNDLKQMGISKKRFGQILRNDAQPTITELTTIGNFLGVSPKDLF